MIVLINSMLSVIPIFYSSFMKMSNKAWMEVVKIKREFIWRGLRKSKKILFFLD